MTVFERLVNTKRHLQPDDLELRASSASGKLQRQVQATIGDLVAPGDDIGLQVAVMHEGRMVVDAVAGAADQRTGEPVTPGTLFFASSAGKGIASPGRCESPTSCTSACRGTFSREWPARAQMAPRHHRRSNRTAAYADIDSGVAIAVMRNQILSGFSTVSAIDDVVTDYYR
jgi:hypothetical protein